MILLVNPSPAVIPASVQLAASPASPAKAQIVVLHAWSGTDKVKIFSPARSAQAGSSRTAMQIAEVPQ